MPSLPDIDALPTTPPATGEAVATFRNQVLEKLTYQVGKDQDHALAHDWFVATALTVRDYVTRQWMESTRRTYRNGTKRVYYFSFEFLIGRQLGEALSNLGLTEIARQALAALGIDLEQVRAGEMDPGLGNGGLGRLAACYLEAMSTLRIPAFGYGIRYDHGIFRQALNDGWQVELPEDWLSAGYPWEFARPEVSYTVGFGGWVETVEHPGSPSRAVWHPSESVKAVAYDTPITGWRGAHVNTLRLWSALAADPLSLEEFHRGDHVGALAERVRLEAVSRVLYPADNTAAGQELRLRQEIFFASASLQDLVRRHLGQHGDLTSLPEHVSIQLNDTHPAIAIPELMRLLIDEHGMDWDAAWDTTRAVFNYTNHTLLPEALEKWTVSMMERLLPRHMQIIFLINALHLDALRTQGTTDPQLLSAVSLIEENGGRHVRMGHLAFLGSQHVNGVSALHSQLMRTTVFKEFDALYPGRIVNKTNGITFRRWLHQANPSLSKLIVSAVGPAVLDDNERLRDLEPLADDAAFREQFAAIRRANKVALAHLAGERLDMPLNPDAIFDVQIKRIHEYKRQLLNLLETVALYFDIHENPTAAWVPRVKIFAGKAAPGYEQAKLIIKLATDVANVVNRDPVVKEWLKVVFLPNYNVGLAESIIPASDVSEQISTAGMEASGTGNMKLALNGALTIGTLDGANIEMQEHIGADNLFIFGLTAEEIQNRRREGIDASAAIAASPALAQALQEIQSGVFSPDDPSRYAGLVDTLRHHDYFMVCADFEAYRATQRTIAATYREPATWWRKSILNTARMSWFSADRAIGEYADQIWHATPEKG